MPDVDQHDAVHGGGVLTVIPLDAGKVVLRDGQVGTAPGCCCCNCNSDGTPPAIASDSDRGLVWLEFLSSCSGTGTGAAGSVDAPRASTPCDYAGMSGAIQAVTLTSGGSGYAQQIADRVAPTVTASVAGGTGATFSVTLSEDSETLFDGCVTVPFWTVSSASVTAGGSGYADQQPITFSVASGDTVVLNAQAYAYVAVDEPVDAVGDVYSEGGGSGAILTPSSWSVISGEFTFRPGLTQNPPYCGIPGRQLYAVSAITITDGGSGYAVDDFIDFSFSSVSDGDPRYSGDMFVDAVDGSGAITAIRIDDGGEYGGSFTDRIATVVVATCINDGGGRYYREDGTFTVFTADVTVTVHQESPSTGSGAVVTATVDDDPESETFGEVITLTLENAGIGYLNVASACSDLDTLYINWGDLSTSINVRSAGFGDYGPICGFYFRQNDGDFDGTEGPYCRGGFYSSFLADAGNLTNQQVLTGWTTPECKCDGFLHITFTLAFFCQECVPAYYYYPFFKEGVTYGSNKFRYRTVCVRFAQDENGCPVGDAEVVGWSVGDLNVVPDIPGNNACRPYTKHDDTYVSNDPCNCSTDCDLTVDPQVSFMP